MNIERVKQLIETYNNLTIELLNYRADATKLHGKMDLKRRLTLAANHTEQVLKKIKAIDKVFESNKELFQTTFGEFYDCLENKLLVLYPNANVSFKFTETGVFPNVNMVKPTGCEPSKYVASVSGVVNLGSYLPSVDLGNIGSIYKIENKPANIEYNSRTTSIRLAKDIKRYEDVKMNILNQYLLYDRFDSEARLAIKNGKSPIDRMIKQTCFDIIEENLRAKHREM